MLTIIPNMMAVSVKGRLNGFIIPNKTARPIDNGMKLCCQRLGGRVGWNIGIEDTPVAAGC